jgi:hypothetical protein
VHPALEEVPTCNYVHNLDPLFPYLCTSSCKLSSRLCCCTNIVRNLRYSFDSTISIMVDVPIIAPLQRPAAVKIQNNNNNNNNFGNNLLCLKSASVDDIHQNSG